MCRTPHLCIRWCLWREQNGRNLKGEKVSELRLKNFVLRSLFFFAGEVLGRRVGRVLTCYIYCFLSSGSFCYCVFVLSIVSTLLAFLGAFHLPIKKTWKFSMKICVCNI